VLFLRIAEPVLPISRGVLVDDTDPDYPPLCYACDDARRQGGVTIWCHNGRGMEAPVAAALGKLDAFNLFDPSWNQSGEYAIWYHLLNCGIRLPASTGSDWFICSNNRVYVKTGAPFSYDGWLQGLKEGKTFITNGPTLFIRLNECTPGDTLLAAVGESAEVEVEWQSHHPVNSVEIIFNGKVVNSRELPAGSKSGSWRMSLNLCEDGWVAARMLGNQRDTFFQPVFAHTSPVWVTVGRPSRAQASSAATFVQLIEGATAWVQTRGKYRSDLQRAEVMDLFRAGQSFYRRLLENQQT
jgi:hypothetical protein